jgi:hypothetical protein
MSSATSAPNSEFRRIIRCVRCVTRRRPGYMLYPEMGLGEINGDVLRSGLEARVAKILYAVSVLPVTQPSGCSLLFPSLNVHPYHQEPQAQRYFCDRSGREIREDPGL